MTISTSAGARPSFDLDEQLSALGIGEAHRPAVRAAVERVSEAQGWSATEAFVVLRWRSRADGRSLVESSAALLTPLGAPTTASAPRIAGAVTAPT